MRRTMLLAAMVVVALSAVLVAGASGSAGSGQSRWVIRDLGVPGQALALNQRGEVVGTDNQADYRSGGEAFLWRDGVVTRLATGSGGYSTAIAVDARGRVLGFTEPGHPSAYTAVVWVNGKRGRLAGGSSSETIPYAMNERGQIVGWKGSDSGSSAGEAVLWQSGRVREIYVSGALAGLPYSAAVAINDRGLIVGNAFPTAQMDPALRRIRSFLWHDGRMTDLGVLPGRPTTVAVAINAHGEIAGSCRADGWVRYRAFVWQNGRMTDLDSLGGGESAVEGEVSGWYNTLATNLINERGQVVGWSTTANGRRHAFVWESRKMTDLGLLRGDESSVATAINDNGLVIGNSHGAGTSDGPSEPHAFVWQNGKLTALGTLGGTASSAVALNNHNQVVGWATTKNGQKHAVMWTLRSG